LRPPPGAWPFDPTVYVGLIALLLGYAALARRTAGYSRVRGLYWVLGVLVVWVALETPIDVLSDFYLQSVHMSQHVLIGIIAPPLLLLGLTPEMAAWLARRIPLLRWAAEPVQAQVIFGVVMIAWHHPLLYDLTLANEGVHVFEHVTFMAGGFLYFWPVVSATAAQSRWQLGDVGRIVYLIVGTFPQDTVALILTFSRHPFYDFYVQAPRIAPALDPLSDQVLAGIALMAAGKISYLVAMLKIFFQWLARARADEQALDEARLASKLT
jgi:putative membrane protein